MQVRPDVDNDGSRAHRRPACPVCGNAGQLAYAEVRDRFFRAPGTWSFRRCRTCDLLWLDPLPTPEDTWRLYGSYYTHEPENAAEGRPFRALRRAAARGLLANLGYEVAARGRWERGLGRAMALFPPFLEAARRSAMYTEGPPRGKLLEIGCGSGQDLRRMGDLGWDVVGIEPDSKAADIARRRHGLRVLVGRAEELELPPEEYGAIVMSHVIEHVHDPVQLLERCWRTLQPGGTLVVLTPNVGSLGHRKFGKAWMHLDPPRHFHLFTVRSLKSTLARAGIQNPSVRSVAATAAMTYDISRQIRARGVADLAERTRRHSLKARLFHAAETVRTRLGQAIGEEILVLATKPALGPEGGRVPRVVSPS